MISIVNGSIFYRCQWILKWNNIEKKNLPKGKQHRLKRITSVISRRVSSNWFGRHTCLFVSVNFGQLLKPVSTPGVQEIKYTLRLLVSQVRPRSFSVSDIVWKPSSRRNVMSFLHRLRFLKTLQVILRCLSRVLLFVCVTMFLFSFQRRQKKKGQKVHWNKETIVCSYDVSQG